MRNQPSQPDDHTLSQRAAAKRLLLWLAVVIAAFVCAALAGSARAEDAGASAPSGAGQRVNTDSVNPMFITDFFTMLKLFGSAAVGAGVLFGVQYVAKRKPSVDEELAVTRERQQRQPDPSDVARMKEKVTTAEDQIKTLFTLIGSIDDKIGSLITTVARLEANQGHNGSAIKEIRQELKSEMQSQDLMHERKHTTLGHRVDEIMKCLADIAARIPAKR